MPQVAENLSAVQRRIAAACAAAGREPAAVRLLAVSKGFDAGAIVQAIAAGQRRFGESYLQEALEKMPRLAPAGLEWHFIGPLQSNKTRGVAEHFHWAHGVDRLRLAQRLSAQRPAAMAPLQVCVQVNVSGEATKSGCAPTEAEALCRAIAQLPGLRLRGLMAIPAPDEDAHAAFGRLRALYESLRAAGLALDTLSAGMSDDLEAAIAQGSTLVRVGTAIFGRRA